MLDERFFYNVFREMTRHRRPPDDVIHVSDVTGCLRKSWFARRRPETSEAQNVILRIGEGLHRELQEFLVSRYGWHAEVEARYPVEYDGGEFELVGHADLVSPDNEVVEIKTTNKIPGDGPYPSHRMQVNSYLYMLKARQGYVLYIEKGTGRIRVYPVQFSPKLWGETVKRAITLHRAIKRGKPPKPERGPLCNYCPYRFDCYATK